MLHALILLLKLTGKNKHCTFPRGKRLVFMETICSCYENNFRIQKSEVQTQDHQKRMRLVRLCYRASLVAQMVKNPPLYMDSYFPNVGNLSLIPGLGRSPAEGNGNTLQYSGLENPHGQRSLVGYNPWGCEESDMTKQLSTALRCQLHKC